LPKLPILTAQEAEVLLKQAGFELLRSKGSHRIYLRGTRRIVIPFHGNRTLHPKIVKSVYQAIEKQG
jgi:predicted RNA binding protein YcfA (HicA-like mRNA interferase family)